MRLIFLRSFPFTKAVYPAVFEMNVRFKISIAISLHFCSVMYLDVEMTLRHFFRIILETVREICKWDLVSLPYMEINWLTINESNVSFQPLSLTSLRTWPAYRTLIPFLEKKKTINDNLNKECYKLPYRCNSDGIFVNNAWLSLVERDFKSSANLGMTSTSNLTVQSNTSLLLVGPCCLSRTDQPESLSQKVSHFIGISFTLRTGVCIGRQRNIIGSNKFRAQ